MTYSIIARCSNTGDIGIAMHSAFFAVGNRCAWVRAGVGVVATQGDTNVSFGPEGLGLLDGGMAAEQAVQQLLLADDDRAGRQLAILAADGSISSHTGAHNIEYTGDRILHNACVQGNWMSSPEVLDAMEQTWLASEGSQLWSRLLDVLDAAENAGGDRRGRQSAALKLARGHRFRNYWEGTYSNVRVDDHADPHAELRRLARLDRATANIYDAIENARLGDRHATEELIVAAHELAPGDQLIEYLYSEISNPATPLTKIRWPLHEIAKRNPT